MFSLAAVEKSIVAHAHAHALGVEVESEIGRAFASLVDHFRSLPAKLAAAEALLEENGYSVTKPAAGTSVPPEA